MNEVFYLGVFIPVSDYFSGDQSLKTTGRVSRGRGDI
jgi:hypothetical protein